MTMSSDLKMMQVALNVSDLPGSLRLFSEVFGFANAGAQAGWGEMMRIQGFEPSARMLVWWMVGRQQGMQLEIFTHLEPAQRPLPADWTPADHGWVRFGIGVPDFDASLAALTKAGVATFTPPSGAKGSRRVAYRDPFAGIIIEIMEENDAMSPGVRHRHFDHDPFVVYAAVSVADIEASRDFFGRVVALPLTGNHLHTAEDESLWGMAGARRESFLADIGDMLIEVVEYRTPRGRPKPADHRLSDQGIMNIALRSLDKPRIQGIIERSLADDPKSITAIVDGEAALGTYIQAPDRQLELVAAAREADPWMGLVPATPLFATTIDPATISRP
jgi:catechol 2,3-dioxygenase-like lactoylglutathione lyase family enzyme